MHVIHNSTNRTHRGGMAVNVLAHALLVKVGDGAVSKMFVLGGHHLQTSWIFWRRSKLGLG